jgi:hypothetical protein
VGDQRDVQVIPIRPSTTLAAASSLARLALAAVSLAAVFYLLPASIAIVAWSADGPSRIALLAPASRLWSALAVGLAAVGGVAALWRASGGEPRRLAAAGGRLSLLLLWVVPFLPWLPDRAPLLFVFAGPLRWVVLGVAVGGAVSALWPGTEVEAHLRPWHLPPSQTRALLFALSAILYVTLGLRFTAAAGFSGDEPHYLVIAHSLLVDHDLDISNNHEHCDYRAFFDHDLRPDYLQRGQHGEIYSIHAPGLPALLVPAYAVGGATGAVVAMAMLAALGGLAIFELASLAAGGAAALVAWAAVCLTVPFVPHAWLIYPDGAGAVIVAWSLLWIWRPPAKPPRAFPQFVHGAVLATLPWMHTKFIVLTVLLAGWQCARVMTTRRDVRATASFLAPIAASTAGWLLFFYRLYGTLNPEAPYGSSTELDVLARNIPRGALGLLFDQKYGLLAYSPVYLLAALGMVFMFRDRERRGLAGDSSSSAVGSS